MIESFSKAVIKPTVVNHVMRLLSEIEHILDNVPVDADDRFDIEQYVLTRLKRRINECLRHPLT